MEVQLPHDVILYQILPKIPAKSVYRFKCVSKEWHSYLTSDMFQNKYNSLHVDDHKLLILSKTKTSLEFTTINCEAPRSVKGLTPTRRPLPPFEGITPGRICILVSGHGLVCLGILKDEHDDEYFDLILWNPWTNENKRLSKSNYHKEFNIWYTYSDFGLYYNCCEDDYKLLHVNFIYTNVHVFPRISILYRISWSRCTYLNENLYFLQKGVNGRLHSIIRFDTKTERLSKIETPNVDVDPYAYNCFATIMVKRDCIHVCVKYDITCDSGIGSTTYIKLWKLDDESGKMKEVVTYQLRTHVHDITLSYLIPVHLMKNGNRLMRACDNHQIYEVDLKKKLHIKEKGEDKEKRNIYDDLDYEKVRVGDNTIVDEEVRYVETFVSPNRYMK